MVDTGLFVCSIARSIRICSVSSFSRARSVLNSLNIVWSCGSSFSSLLIENSSRRICMFIWRWPQKGSRLTMVLSGVATVLKNCSMRSRNWVIWVCNWPRLALFIGKGVV